MEIDIFSEVSPEVLLHKIFKASDNKLVRNRQNISPEGESLQVAFLPLRKAESFKPHKHLVFPREMPMAQESWVVISGSVNVQYYDTDGKLLRREDIFRGDCSITYRGGHGYTALTDDTIVYEFKTGPYIDAATDKQYF